ncbi:hypothetical protein EIN_390670 [Entamoeba invadens IP1]|uniref:Uncharacterized protein n=1 Tax=Entamoeba invadens IP1 TaxID=370355 RepID=A0A0A1U5D7_ENTIV|nr:hypothetical protein EIN_390670 [Entamoeba invadens IP1]ELP89442.1 hypothetical protein EIN_390670 [Entamoeba invadens IP1]|eukprot:XP_004256213.1 hypothetical protein EIN_390670 [Entamoeba invadens IP1]
MEPIEVQAYCFDDKSKTLSVGTTYGFVVYGLEKKDPYVRYKRTLGSGIGLITSLESTGVVGYVGGGKTPYSRANDVEVWDDSSASVVLKKKYENDVKALLLKRKYLIVVLEQVTIVHKISCGVTLRYPTCANPYGLVGFYEKTNCLITLGEKEGTIGFSKLTNNANDKNEVDSIVTCCKSAITTLVVHSGGLYAVVFCPKKQSFSFIDLQSKEKYLVINHQGSTLKQPPFISMSQVIMTVVCGDSIYIYDILKKKNKIYSQKLERTQHAAAFLSSTGGMKLFVIDKSGLLDIYDIDVNANQEVSFNLMMSKGLLQ